MTNNEESTNDEIEKSAPRRHWAHLDTTTIVEARSLSRRGTSGERAGERGTFHRIGAANWNPLSLTLSPLLRPWERESTNGMVVVSRCAPRRALPRLAWSYSVGILVAALPWLASCS